MTPYPLLWGKTACVYNVVPKFPTRFAASRRPIATQEMGKTLVLNFCFNFRVKFLASEKIEAYIHSRSFNAYKTKIGKYRK